jgi:hypothetical protein
MFRTSFPHTRNQKCPVESQDIHNQYPGRGSNPYGLLGPQDFKSCVSTNSTTQAVNESAKAHHSLPSAICWCDQITFILIE